MEEQELENMITFKNKSKSVTALDSYISKFILKGPKYIEIHIFQHQNWVYILSNTDSIHCQKSVFHLDRINVMWNYITEIQFSKLKDLSIKCCYLDSIESLYLLQAPYIQVLNLSDNVIFNILPLRKLNYKELKVLNLSNNQIQQLEKIEEISKNKLGRLVLGKHRHSINKQGLLINYQQLTKINVELFIWQCFIRGQTKLHEKFWSKFLVQKL